jgi:YbbR domain-containing protein
MRAASLVFAVILWFFVTWDKNTFITKDLRVPLRYQDITDGYSISSTVKNVDISLEGTFEALALMNSDSITASVGIQDLRPGKYRLPVQISPLPANVRVASSNPQTVDFELFRMIERTMRPSLVTRDETPQNLTMGNVDISPGEISVKGPEADVMAIRRAEVRSSIKELFRGEKELPVILVANEGSVAQSVVIDPPVVKVKVSFTESTQEVNIPVSVKVTGTPREGFEVGAVTVSPDVVTIRGSREALRDIKELEINTINVAGHVESMNVDIPLELPAEGVTFAGPNHVNVRVEIRTAVETKTFTGVSINLRGTLNTNGWSISPPTANITVERSMIASEPFNVDKPPLELYVDVTNVVASQIVLPVLVRNLADGMNVIRIEPQQVAVNVIIP